MAYNPVGPKVQSTNMAPRPNAKAINRRQQNKPNAGVSGFGLDNKTPKPPKWTGFGGGPFNNIPRGPAKPKGPMAPPPVSPPTGPPVDGTSEIEKYLAGDDIYQNILASLAKNKELSESSFNYNKGNYQTDHETIKRRLSEQETQDNELLDDDYAARGLFSSGLFAKADSDLGQKYADQFTDLEQALQRNLQQLQFDFDSQNNLAEETRRQAELDAITRRAQEFGIFGGPTLDAKEERKERQAGKKPNKPNKPNKPKQPAKPKQPEKKNPPKKGKK